MSYNVWAEVAKVTRSRKVAEFSTKLILEEFMLSLIGQNKQFNRHSYKGERGALIS